MAPPTKPTENAAPTGGVSRCGGAGSGSAAEQPRRDRRTKDDDDQPQLVVADDKGQIGPGQNGNHHHFGLNAGQE